MQEVWDIISWSFEAVFDGRFPKSDHNGVEYTADSHPAEYAIAGNDLAGGYFGVIWGIKADLDYLAKGLGLRFYGRDDFCECCP